MSPWANDRWGVINQGCTESRCHCHRAFPSQDQQLTDHGEFWKLSSWTARKSLIFIYIRLCITESPISLVHLLLRARFARAAKDPEGSFLGEQSKHAVVYSDWNSHISDTISKIKRQGETTRSFPRHLALPYSQPPFAHAEPFKKFHISIWKPLARFVKTRGEKQETEIVDFENLKHKIRNC